MRRPSGTTAMSLRMMRAEPRAVISSPSNQMLPLLGVGSPHSVISKVVLPAPLAPIRVTISPCSTLTLTSCSAWILP